MSELDPRLLALFDAQRRSVLVTLRRDGRPQLSNVMHHWDAATSTATISVTADRAKTRNASRDPRVSLHVTTEDFWSYAVLDGRAVLGPVATDPGDEAVAGLVEYYRRVAGEHPDWDEFRRAQVAERRQLLSVTAEHVYGSAH
ncbi:PPOX class F420-dependent oxidoreductase [Auraticoccus monumenti]|uniref:PPOX class probable F420-dependent enzyme n=1 Tax=Auraticoccus monumenti TaxID=675864 RepID=A0A1G6V2B7_9ACTN|nr:PPOX class F420-dependent oxidoreductase [Auraticoccus monumenti]SDD47634.1 PPOX class probable F420-dependent enzyme [Auraticoccus monumenti]